MDEDFIMPSRGIAIFIHPTRRVYKTEVELKGIDED